MTVRIATLVLAILAVAAAPAIAAPDHTVTFSAANTKFDWQGAPQTTRGAPLYNEDARTSVPCKTPARPCEDVLIKVDEAGKFTVKVDAQDDGSPRMADVDLYIYKSDASGTAGEKVASSGNAGADGITVAKATPGYYLAQVDYYHAANTGYVGTASFTPAAPPAASAPAPVTPAPPAAAPAPASPAPAQSTPAKKKSKKARCQAKAKKIKNAKKRKAALKRCKKIKG